MLDREKLAKVMALTKSPVPHEATAAMRMANNMLSTEGLTWEEVLAPARAPVTVTVTRGFAAPEFYAAMEEWTIRQKR